MTGYQVNPGKLTKYLFFTGKGGVGKTSVACATAISLADQGQRVALVSTDPASNLQDVFDRQLNELGTTIDEVDGLTVANFDPIRAANVYMESVVAPYRGLLPESAIRNMEEQLSGSCTVEVASFNQFANFLTNPQIAEQYDTIIFDTAPTGHTIRLLQLPSAWTNFLDENTTGTSCLGQLSGLGEQRDSYRLAVDKLADSNIATIMLVSRPQEGPLVEAARAYEELKELGIHNQKLIINGILEDPSDNFSNQFALAQKETLKNIPENLIGLETYSIPLRPYNLSNIDNLRLLLSNEQPKPELNLIKSPEYPRLSEIVADLASTNKRVIFTMGKGGVGKTTVAATIALGLSESGKKVHLTTTDPAAHLDYIIHDVDNVEVSHIDEEAELQKYQEEVLAKARETMSEEDVAYVQEDLRSPCTQEIAVFRKFADIVSETTADVVVIDTAPTGHTLLLLDSSQSYAKEVERSSGESPESVRNLLPILQDGTQTEVVMVTLPENTPVYESIRLMEDLDRANIAHTWWVINNSMLDSSTTNQTLLARAQSEQEWIDKVKEVSNDHFAVIRWTPQELKNDNLKTLLRN